MPLRTGDSMARPPWTGPRGQCDGPIQVNEYARALSITVGGDQGMLTLLERLRAKRLTHARQGILRRFANHTGIEDVSAGTAERYAIRKPCSSGTWPQRQTTRLRGRPDRLRGEARRRPACSGVRGELGAQRAAELLHMGRINCARHDTW